MHQQNTPNSQSNAEKEQHRGVTLPRLKINHTALGIKIVCYWHENKYTEQWNRIDSPEVNPHIYRQFHL